MNEIVKCSSTNQPLFTARENPGKGTLFVELEAIGCMCVDCIDWILFPGNGEGWG